MPERSLVLTAPVPISGPNLAEHVTALVAADVLVRHARGRGLRLPWGAAVCGGGLAGQYATDEELVREGLDRPALGRDAFATRAAAVEADRRAELGAVLDGLDVGLDLKAASALGAQAGRVARTAFVRLFDAGLVMEDERIVDVCPHCSAVIPAGRAVADQLDVEALLLRLTLMDGPEVVGRMEVRCLHPELLPGTAAVVVPAGHPAAGRSAAVPLAGTVVPVVADRSVDEPRLLTPAHDSWSLDLARRLGLSAPGILDRTGVVRAPGPLDGLARHAARAAAIPLLEAEGAVAA
ncbi:MAG: class I tRNA ligase family protein, partial [Acidimicrobiales bacterium]